MNRTFEDQANRKKPRPPCGNRGLFHHQTYQTLLRQRRNSARLAPGADHIDEIPLISGPVMQRGRIEVGSVRPHQRMDFAVDCDLIEKPEVVKRAVQLTGENRKEINGLLGAVVEPNLDSVWGHNREFNDAAEQMWHAFLF